MKFQHALLVTTMLATPGLAWAQDSAPDEAEDHSNVIVVTAQNRVEDVQKVPIVIDVIAGEAIKNAGVTDLIALQRVAPVVNIVSDTVNTRVAIRGIGSNSNDEAQDQTVAVNIDGEFINRPNSLNASLFDLQRVEVLRGPQGTLYGRNSTAGVITFITRKPGREFAANGSLSYGNFNHVIAEGGIDIPLGQIGGIRFAGQYSNREGFNFHPNINARSQDDNTLSLRASLLLEPTDRLTINGAVERIYSDTITAAQAFANYNAAGFGPGVGCSAPGWVEIAPAVPGTQCIPQNTNNLRNIDRSRYNAPSTGLGRIENSSWAFRSKIAYDFGPVLASYTMGYRTTERSGNITLQPNYSFNNFIDDVDTQSHELLFSGQTDWLKWQFGGFYFKEILDVERGLYRAPPPPTLLGPNGGYVNYFIRQVTAESKALFGQADISLADKFTLVVGGRYTDENRRARYVNFPGGLNQPTNPLFNVGNVRPTVLPRPTLDAPLGSDDNAFTWAVGLNYEPNADTMIYGRVATGFKGGGFDAVGTYDPEFNTAYEVGTKINFGATGRNFVNLAAFYYDYRDLQVSVLIDSALGAQVFNAGSAEVWGVEADTQIAVGANGTFRASVNYVKPTYETLLASIPVVCVNPGCAGNGSSAVGDLQTRPGVITQPDLGGRKPPQTPNWTISVGYDHEFSLGDAGTITAGVFSFFRSSYFTDIFNYNDSRQGSFTQSDANLTYAPADRKWFIQAFVRNIEGTRSLSFASFTVAGADRLHLWQFNPPRTYGVRVGFDF